MNKPFFSIITCTYNSAKYLQQNLDSVKSQSFTNYEHIFVDGFSIDETGKMLKDCQSNIVIQAPAQGIANAMNLGIKAANGEYLVFLNSDDYFCDSKVLEQVANQIKTKEYLWYYGITNIVSEDGKILHSHPRKVWQQSFKYWIISLTFYMQHQSIFYSRSLFDKYGLYDETFNAMDFEYAMRIRKLEKAGFVNTTVANFRLGGFSSKNKQIMENDTKNILTKHFYFGKIYFLVHGVYVKFFVRDLNRKNIS